jgi:hypothetical protein
MYCIRRATFIQSAHSQTRTALWSVTLSPCRGGALISHNTVFALQPDAQAVGLCRATTRREGSREGNAPVQHGSPSREEQRHSARNAVRVAGWVSCRIQKQFETPAMLPLCERAVRAGCDQSGGFNVDGRQKASRRVGMGLGYLRSGESGVPCCQSTPRVRSDPLLCAILLPCKLRARACFAVPVAPHSHQKPTKL